jgi:hypothetical protein
MAQRQETWSTPLLGCYSATLAELHAEQGRIRAACLKQRRRAATMREEAIEIRAQSRRLRATLASDKLA